MSKENTFILHSLMTDMQLAYYWAYLFDAKGEPRVITDENLAELEVAANRASRNTAIRAIKNKRIPKRLYVYANAFAVHPTPIVVVDKTYHLYAQDNSDDIASLDQSV